MDTLTTEDLAFLARPLHGFLTAIAIGPEIRSWPPLEILPVSASRAWAPARSACPVMPVTAIFWAGSASRALARLSRPETELSAGGPLTARLKLTKPLSACP